MKNIFDFDTHPYSYDKNNKLKAMIEGLNILTKHHMDNCNEYRDIILKVFHFEQQVDKLRDFPFFPVNLFKQVDLKSIDDSEIFKVLLSSGTSSQIQSKIYLDSYTSIQQKKALFNTVNPIIGSKRLPMIIIDNKNVIRDRATYNARGAGILGFSIFGRDHFYLLDDQMNVNWEGLYAYLNKHKNEKILLFGFTYIVWRYFYREFSKQNKEINLSNSILIHGGGWKKLLNEEVQKNVFNNSLYQTFGMKKIINYYGMIEQVGSVFFECENGYLHAPNYADLLIRDPISFEILPNRKKGVLQVFSLLPFSYPGHSLLTEDLGEIVGEDDCMCGKKGKYFNVYGRLPSAEVRGCSDTQP